MKIKVASLPAQLNSEVFSNQKFEKERYSELIKKQSIPCKNNKIKVNKNILILIGLYISHTANNPKKDPEINVGIENIKNVIIEGVPQIFT